MVLLWLGRVSTTACRVLDGEGVWRPGEGRSSPQAANPACGHPMALAVELELCWCGSSSQGMLGLGIPAAAARAGLGLLVGPDSSCPKVGGEGREPPRCRAAGPIPGESKQLITAVKK